MKIFLLLIVLLLGGCASKPQVVEKIETVEVLTPVDRPLDARLTKIAPEPKAPPAKCTEGGYRTVCNEDLMDHLDDLRTWGRGMAKQLTEILGLQPKPTP